MTNLNSKTSSEKSEKNFRAEEFFCYALHNKTLLQVKYICTGAICGIRK